MFKLAETSKSLFFMFNKRTQVERKKNERRKGKKSILKLFTGITQVYVLDTTYFLLRYLH